MALLTADDVLNKKFQPTKFREGYDQDEVDDFLDEVVNTLREVYAENAALKAQLEAQGQQSAPASDEVPAQFSPPEPMTQEFTEPVVDAGPETAETQVEQPWGEMPQEPPTAAQPEVPVAPVAATEPESATGMLQLAQRLHDEYVNDGKAEAGRLLAAAREESERLTGEAEELRTRTLNQLDEERTTLERKIDELRSFERNYRVRLKGYLEDLLRNVEGGQSMTDPLGSPTPGTYDLR